MIKAETEERLYGEKRRGGLITQAIKRAVGLGSLYLPAIVI